VIDFVHLLANEWKGRKPLRREEWQSHCFTVLGLDVATPIWFFVLVLVPLFVESALVFLLARFVSLLVLLVMLLAFGASLLSVAKRELIFVLCAVWLWRG
jgi:hypothetical protein